MIKRTETRIDVGEQLLVKCKESSDNGIVKYSIVVRH